MLLNYLDVSKYLVMLTIILMVSVTYLLLTTESPSLLDEAEKNCKKEPVKKTETTTKKVEEEKRNKTPKKEEEKNMVEIKGFHQNEINKSGKFILSEKTEKIEHLSQKLVEAKNANISKNEELSIMFIESLSSLNSWKNNKIETQLSKEVNWNIEKRESINEEEESLVYQYVFPKSKIKDNISTAPLSGLHVPPNLSSSQSSVISNADTEDGEEEKEKAIFAAYKLGICRTFDYSVNYKLKSNIVKEVNGNYYKIYSQGEPDLIKEKCNKETIPEKFDDIVNKYKKEGCVLIGLSGKKMKMNYIQSQRIDRTKCESNMVFLGFAVYKENNDGYKYAYS